uniref:PROTEIN/DNA Complex catalytic motif, Helix-turn-helix DNA n=1 Tax=Siphoviridae sp. ctZHD14 TaxID=2827891 RepID=A0A8S5SWC8_9CAUD|nr:MAG TPA: PROTEIN/DNA Complex catalytic motif, Helix-turn-helix DNA [Siphoviridae sp. ctZHD14]
MSEAYRQTGCSVSKISLVCSGKRNTTGGYKWITQ